MIDRQSSQSIVALGHYPGSPKGCRKLAGDSIPGNNPNNPRALKGRWKRIHFSCPFRPSVSLSLSKAFQGTPGILPSLSKPGYQGFPWLSLGLSKPIQGVPSLSKPFSEKKRLFIFYPPHLPHLTTARPANSQSKSTIDLELEPLIWGKNGLPTPFLPGYRHSFGPIMTGKLWNTGQIQTNTGQKDESFPHCSANEKAGAHRQNKINYPPLIYG
jgi:hypothetical protein